ncbi:MAG: hypothetical protein IPK16_19100 [Anaerolineales bacterium]|nr:hypothetical protein [Anaerolineales bacterium]
MSTKHASTSLFDPKILRRAAIDAVLSSIPPAVAESVMFVVAWAPLHDRASGGESVGWQRHEWGI